MKSRITFTASIIFILLSEILMSLPFSLSYPVAPEPNTTVYIDVSFFNFRTLLFRCANFIAPITVILSAVWSIMTIVVVLKKKHYGATCLLGIATSLCSFGCIFWFNGKPQVSILISMIMIAAASLQLYSWHCIRKAVE